MTDTVTFYRNLVSQVGQFVNAFENIKLMADRIAADSALSAAAQASAQATGRTDLYAADFDNFKSAVDLLTNTLETSNAGVNTGGKVVLALYKLL